MSKTKLILFSLFIVIASACNETAPTEEIAPTEGNNASSTQGKGDFICENSDQCGGGGVCFDGTCTTYCIDNLDCSDGGSCVENACVYETYTCENSDDCGGGGVCFDGTCTTYCIDNLDCSDGGSCVENACVYDGSVEMSEHAQEVQSCRDEQSASLDAQADAGVGSSTADQQTIINDYRVCLEAANDGVIPRIEAAHFDTGFERAAGVQPIFDAFRSAYRDFCYVAVRGGYFNEGSLAGILESNCVADSEALLADAIEGHVYFGFENTKMTQLETARTNNEACMTAYDAAWEVADLPMLMGEANDQLIECILSDIAAQKGVLAENLVYAGFEDDNATATTTIESKLTQAELMDGELCSALVDAGAMAGAAADFLPRGNCIANLTAWRARLVTTNTTDI